MIKQVLLAMAVIGMMVHGPVLRGEATDIKGYSQAAANDFKSMKKSLGVEQYEPKVKRAKEQDDEYDRQHPENRTTCTKNEMEAYAGVVSDGYSKLFAALNSYDFDKARVLSRDCTIDHGEKSWYKYRRPEYDHIDSSAIGQVIEAYVPGAEDIHDHGHKMSEKLAGFVSKFTEEHDKKMKDFFKKVFKNPWSYYDDYKKEQSQATFIYPKCAERTLYYPEAYLNYASGGGLGGLEVILNYKFWAEEGLGVYIHSNIWMGNEEESAISGMLQKYNIIDQGSSTLILENPQYKEYVLIHNFKGRKSLAMFYFIDGTGDLAKQMTFYLKDYLSSGSVDLEGEPEEVAEGFDLEALDKTSLSATPAEPNTCRLKVTTKKSTAVIFEKPEWGELSAMQAVTDVNGEAIVVYEAPNEEELADRNRVSVDIVARVESTGAYDYVSVTVDNTSGKITVEVDNEILPSVSDYYSRIAFKFRGPDKEYKAVISVKQKDGALVRKRDEKGGSNQMELKVRSGETNEVFYHWAGKQEMTSAREDIITIEIPDLKLKEELKISVGIDLQPLRVENDWRGAAFPGVYYPFKVYVNDGFHPKADAAELFKKFHFKAKLTVTQDYFEPVTIYDPDKEGWLSRFISHMEGAVIPQGALLNNIIKAKLEKSKQGDAFLIDEDWKEEKNAQGALPGAIPYDRGNYQFGFELTCECDSNKNNNKILSQMIDVEEYSAHGEMLNEFLVPTMKSSVSVLPEADLVVYAIDTGVNLYEGNYTEAIVDTGFQIGSNIVGKQIDIKRTEAHLKRLVAKARRKTVSELFEKELKYCLDRAKELYVANMGAAISNLTAGKIKDEIMSGGSVESPAQITQSTGREFLHNFLKGYGDYGLVILNKDGVDSYKIYDQKGNELKDAPEQIFSGPPEDERIFDEEEVVVVPFKLGEKIQIQPQGTGKSAEIVTITPNGVTEQEYPKEKGESKIQIAEESGGGLDVSGNWKTSFGTLTLSQSASSVTGNYTSDDGKIGGAIKGNVLKGAWSESPSYKPPKDAGDVEFVFSEDGKSFKGKWRYGHGGSGWKGNWSGTRM